MSANRLYGVTIFLGAFLLFQIQPIIGRHLLPFFGGAVSVWGTSLLFFTTTLFLGYSYAYVLTKITPYRASKVHLGVILTAVSISLLYPLIFGTVYPSLLWTMESGSSPIIQVLIALTASVGIPYFLLATTGPLVQHWFSVLEKREPYHLYSLSNAASFIALGTYPFFIEPLFTLGFQKALWLFLFVIFAVAYARITLTYIRSVGKEVANHLPTNTSTTPPLFTMLGWVCLATLPGALLSATTTQITQVVAPMPFIWILPLALYLLTFIVAFRGRATSGWIPLALFIAAGCAFSLLGFSYDAVTRQFVAYLILFALAALFCHAELFA